MEDKLKVKNNATGDIIPLMLTFEEDGIESYVVLKWDKETREITIECKNTTIDKGAQKFFEDFRDKFGQWIAEQIHTREQMAEWIVERVVKQIKYKADTCQYCGR